ncbi:hypothetical protein PISMIDRAFT_16884 [Pisolithus microcarpus 441]|uniref:PSP1 C-terminal domain-containing protein n=1 Tax=Pisolithus microcarpus 441 TaxID=765257 RepID=A0A0C9Z4P3_9AGAM|nr:hypothetical protein PISMIDRAFT_16884 [Pisolithus microcarpus 441]
MSLTVRFIPGKGIQYLPRGNNDPPPYNRSTSQGSVPSSLLPTTGRPIQPQQGVLLSSVPASWPLYIVEFKAGRTDLFYLTDLSLDIRVGDLVIVQADGGKDLGTVVNDSITLKEVEAFEREQRGRQGSKKEINPKMIYGKAQPQDRQQLLAKAQDELKALQLCQNKVRQKKLVIDAEYQWDRRKLTFYFIAEKRIDFREPVRELFRLYETLIWMASLQGPGGYEQ